MNILVTAGNTLVPIDRVRCITNIFTGRTGARIALFGHERGHTVTLLTSHPDVVKTMQSGEPPPAERWQVSVYRTFDDLQERMAAIIQGGGLDAVIHSAAVSDYRAAGIYAPAPDTRFREDGSRWESAGDAPSLVDMNAGKVKSDEPELWLRLVRTPKLVDRVRSDWGFRGVLVKFKLEVGVSEEQLLEIAERSRRHSAADLMVANTLEGASYWAQVGLVDGQYQRVSRLGMLSCLYDAIERLHGERGNG
jgi:phosphopantothenoylcysteine synthetase/decarboxylase